MRIDYNMPLIEMEKGDIYNDRESIKSHNYCCIYDKKFCF